MTDLKTMVKVYTDDEGHQHYEFVIDKEHMDLIKSQKFTPAERDVWNRVSKGSDDFFKRAYGFILMVNLLHGRMNSNNAE